ncbi:MAG: FAD-dependent oxidoreductase [Candidatus Pacebacteria bacterium]|nr:FAD-dependent oxidoreductase [Candidatus Paceibacterota bacterium]
MPYDLIIVGGGPAGITAGIYAARQKLNTLLITKAFGGQVARKAVPIENYPGMGEISSLELIHKFEEHLKKQEIKVEFDTISNIKKEGDFFSVITGSKKEFQSKTVIIASGADPRPLEIPGEKEFIGKGVSYCVTCDGPLFAGKTVVVIGGGNAGFEAAILLANLVKKIYILEFSPKARADSENQERAGKTGKVEVVTSAALKRISGGKFVNSVIYQDNNTKELITLKIDGVFVEIGSQPATSFVKGLVDFSERDEIKIDPKTMQTKTPGLFAAGDVSDVVYKQIVIAAGEGAKAALSVSNYLQKLSPVTTERK